jgi:hypothetical protein
MRITIDTREDSYQDALGVLRRAYGRHRLARKTEEPSGGVAKESDNRSASAEGRNDTGVGQPLATRTKKSPTGRAAAARAAAVDSAAPRSTGKRAAGKTARSAPSAQVRPGTPRKRSASKVATNTAPRGQSEAVRAWAQKQGMQVSARGRMPGKVIAAYLEAHDD